MQLADFPVLKYVLISYFLRLGTNQERLWMTCRLSQPAPPKRTDSLTPYMMFRPSQQHTSCMLIGTMPSADFYLITDIIADAGAVPKVPQLR